MTVLNFPASPTLNDTYTENGVTYTWNGTYWSAGSDSQQVNSDWDATSGVAEILNKPTIPTNASETVAGIAEIATTAEVSAGTDDARIVTPLKLKQAEVWTRGGGGLIPTTAADNVFVGGTASAPNISLNAADGSATFSKRVTAESLRAEWDAPIADASLIYAKASTSGTVGGYLLYNSNGTLYVRDGANVSNTLLNATGSASFAGGKFNITNTGAIGLGGANYGSSGQVLTSQGSGLAPQWATVSTSTSNLTRGTAVSLTGSSVTFTSLPAGIRRLVISVNLGSATGNTDLGIRIGGSGGIESTGYDSSTSYLQGSYFGTRGSDSHFQAAFNYSDRQFSGNFELINHSGNIWTFRGLLTESTFGTTVVAAGGKELSGELTQIQLFPVLSSQSFTAGTVNIMYEV